jgi:hypothetical protein
MWLAEHVLPDKMREQGEQCRGVLVSASDDEL